VVLGGKVVVSVSLPVVQVVSVETGVLVVLEIPLGLVPDSFSFYQHNFEY
jgi:hypothetical protein